MKLYLEPIEIKKGMTVDQKEQLEVIPMFLMDFLDIPFTQSEQIMILLTNGKRVLIKEFTLLEEVEELTKDLEGIGVKYSVSD